MSIAVFSNASDVWAPMWHDSAVHILSTVAHAGAPSRNTRDWHGGWWKHWRQVDLAPVSGRVLAAMPVLFTPFADATEFDRREQ